MDFLVEKRKKKQLSPEGVRRPPVSRRLCLWGLLTVQRLHLANAWEACSLIWQARLHSLGLIHGRKILTSL